MTAHDLIKHGPRQYECRVCSQTWSRKPGSNCPRVKVYARYDYDPLMTRGQLGYYGYKTSENALPPTAGCYYLPALGDYVMLYDPAQAVKTHAQPLPRTRIAITEILWPVKWLPLIERFNSYSCDGKFAMGYNTADRVHEIASIIGILLTFTPDEIEHLAGATVKLVISPRFARRSYPSADINQGEQRDLAKSLATAYERLKASR